MWVSGTGVTSPLQAKATAPPQHSSDLLGMMPQV